MTTQEQVDYYLAQPRRYFNIDGLGEIGMGVMMLGYGLIGWLEAATPDTSVWHRTWFFVVYMALILTAIGPGTKIIKKRVTYPRTGFVEYRRGAKDRAIPMLASAVTAGAVVVLMYQRAIYLAPMIGILLALAYAYHLARAVRWKWLVAVVLAAGSFAIASLPISFLASVAHDSAITPKSPAAQLASWLVEALFIGATMLVSGGITLYQYLSTTQAPGQAVE